MGKKKRLSFLTTRGITFIGLIGTGCSILGFVSGSIWRLPNTVLGTSYVCFAVSLCIILVWESRNRVKAESETSIHQQMIRKLHLKAQGLDASHGRLERAFENLHEVLHHARDCYCLLDFDEGEYTESRNERFLSEIKNLLDKIVHLFQEAYDLKCSVCIKLITDFKTMEVSTLRRDTKSARERVQEDKIAVHIDDHCAFSKIVIDRERHFFSRDFVADEKKSNFWARHNWRKHYRSGSALPIKRDIEYSNSNELVVLPDYLGFLCLDTMKKNKLTEEFTVSVLAGIADVLYVVCKRYKSLIGGNGNGQ